MKYLLGFLLGITVATAYSVGAQVLTPYDATIEQRLEWDRIGSALRMERDLERWEHEREALRHRDPC